jgi:hypothetical protein
MKEALKLALEALKTIDEAMPFPVAKLAQAAIKEALAQPDEAVRQGRRMSKQGLTEVFREHMTNDEALTLEALKYAASLGDGRIVREMNISPFSIRCDEALAQEQQSCDNPEQGASLKMQDIVCPNCGDMARTWPKQKRPWVGLTREEINSALGKYSNWYNFAAHLENILKEKNQ